MHGVIGGKELKGGAKYFHCRFASILQTLYLHILHVSDCALFSMIFLQPEQVAEVSGG